MKTEELKAKGLTDEQVSFVMAEYGKEINPLKTSVTTLTADNEKLSQTNEQLSQSLTEVQGKLEAFKDVNVEELQSQIGTLTNDLQAEKDARTADARKAELEKSVETFLSDKQFVNDITAASIRDKLTAELDKDTAKGKSIEDLFSGIVTDDEGKQIENILVTEAEKNKARFTTKSGKMPSGDTKLAPSELMKLKNENPDLDITQYI